MTHSGTARIGGVAAITGALLLSIATFLHPMDADPNDAEAAFAEYAADRLWVASHLGQFAGVALLGASLVALAGTMEGGRAAAWARLGIAGTAASVAATAALQAVDGVALKVAVDRWSGATGDARALAFEAAFAVRQIEIGLASLMSILFGMTIVTFALAMIASRRYPRPLAWLGAAGGIGTVAGGLAQAYTGFSPLAMNIGMPAGALVIVWALGAGASMWRLASSPTHHP